MMDAETWLLDWFAENGDVDPDEIRDRPDESYLEADWIDSARFVQLVAETEKHFDVRFTDDALRDPAFHTIDGLVRAIDQADDRDGDEPIL